MPSDAITPSPPFRFTRESKIRIDRNGKFWHENEPVQHPGLARALASWIDLDQGTDRYVLRNSMDWCFITVEDAPLIVQSIAFSPELDTFVLSLSDGTTEPVQWDTLRIDEDDIPYCDVRGGRLTAKFSRDAAFKFFEHVPLSQDLSHGIETWMVELPKRKVLLRKVKRGEGAPRKAPTKDEE